ncbi:MAG: hypothetical protein A2365_03095 [Candidatus Nealsonbacteria bacterium RIFOXYB1_FULL_40_15]|uniref:RNA polymerase sigma factor n=2 Tax=Candidatus Nealsoniibacteriota TaxID=1817911 RepID=A0A1G2ETZ3_9BACT|nr:MAG: hypothetical protein A2365_03095 [Candidatus Nealsonbacteria bacterium RIFOXYB1_FULL_40_15]OGZ29213.1 MAG: hypothetical protein A2427_02950 [Candidatus Nealsonbacteria bacterium RIFOXYC1_FULL_40_7]OGZ29896.1 MAG: hypothetical protein A2562_02130 [Candidatus Nealsonbacteria bacterium RIFOXYD1_FULL_39_11]
MSRSYGKDKEIYEKKKEFSEIYDRYADSIYRYSFYRVYSADIAEDITQETFTKTWKYMKQGRTVREMRPFLYRVAKNLIIDLYRKKKFTDRRSLEEILSSKKAAKLSYRQEELFENNDLARRVFEIMQKLPRIYQDVLVMRYVENMKLKEIAEACNTTVKNISARNRRAIQKLEVIIRR